MRWRWRKILKKKLAEVFAADDYGGGDSEGAVGRKVVE